MSRNMNGASSVTELYSEFAKGLETYIMFRIKQQVAELKDELTARNRTPISMSIGAPVQAPPQLVIDALKEAVSGGGVHSYSSSKGEPFFSDAVKTRMKNRFDVDVCEKTEICSLIGSKEGLANMFRSVITSEVEKEKQDIILIPDPGYASYKEQIRIAGGLAYPVLLNYENKFMPNMDDVLEGLKKDGLDPKKIKALVVNYPNNPLGSTATREYLQSVVDFCLENNILLISDAAYCDMFFEGEEAPASILEFRGAKNIAIEFHSLSKPYAMTGWRLGWACGNADAVGILAKMKSTADTGVFKAIQKAGSIILNSKEGDEYIKNSTIAYQKKQEILLKGFRELGWPIDSLIIPKATFYLWLPIPPKYKTSEEFTTDLLAKSGIVAVPGSGFGDNGEGFFRLSMVLADEKLHEVVARMKEDGFKF